MEKGSTDFLLITIFLLFSYYSQIFTSLFVSIAFVSIAICFYCEFLMIQRRTPSCQFVKGG